MSVLANVGPAGYPLGADPLSLTPRFSGFSRARKTAEAVRGFNPRNPTPLKRSVNEIIQPGI